MSHEINLKKVRNLARDPKKICQINFARDFIKI